MLPAVSVEISKSPAREDWLPLVSLKSPLLDNHPMEEVESATRPLPRQGDS